MVDVFDQVEEELRSDRYKRLARTWLPVVGGVLLVALIAALAWWGWQKMETSKADKASIAYQRGLESLESNNLIGADAAFVQAADEGNAAYKALALQHRAGIALQQNRIPAAVELFDEAAAASRDPLLRDVAAYKAVMALMDTASLEDIQGRLEPLMEEGRPYRAFAREALAMAQLQHGKTAEARSTLVVLKNGLDTPRDVSQRAELALASIDDGTAANIPAILDAMAAREAEAAAARTAAPAPRAENAPAEQARP
ncbi:tetratricopeptide repeat protein [Roseibacterium beibuensis]|uniref:tetratricopeptide repeat protein n=1 Tax=[Roseibacterium] beibuensis TaxID=1193142 RepID=UPI00217E77DE|nr:tetratricopeptide repeat protein [Roseibacterium beibuensis]MCS6625006.1 tetratricopeptide repeat protein [Roseibacterium beibuensis]